MRTTFEHPFGTLDVAEVAHVTKVSDQYAMFEVTLRSGKGIQCGYSTDSMARAAHGKLLELFRGEASDLQEHDTLIIEHVDLEELEKQRKALNRLLFDTNSKALGGGYNARVLLDVCGATDVELLRGLESMLDYWSDKIYHQENDTGLEAT